MMSDTMRNNTVEDELDAVRLALYEQTKGMTASEMTAYIKKQIAPTVEKYHIPALPTTRAAQAARRLL